ncbi:glycosyl hydrolase family 28-related protein [Bradyrhizobium sp. 30]|uniref:glycosyl hydrolase family 28-related protein n=1 Tax=Bradyrhizobium sp. 30 TaxID=2782669 RepID=UPI001FFB2C70|nr:glycosyl hydrolase family 28-related protein [Bradyrhizobium sp. 30]MCK1294838.1 hypothetical protein [Bradyrhizobium sp. 30]
MELLRCCLRLFALSIAYFTASFVSWGAKAEPTIFWNSDPISPGETVLVVGNDLAGVKQVQIRRLANDPDHLSARDSKSFEVEPAQVGDNSLKFVVPRSIGEGAYSFSFTGTSSTSYQLNEPSVYWLQGDQGDVSGVEGWVRILGRNIARTSETRLTFRSADGSETIDLRPISFNLWNASFSLPPSLSAGQYTVRLWNGNGDSGTGRELGVWRVEAMPSPPTLSLNPKDFGAVGDGKHDDTASVKEALLALSRSGGGTLTFPRGYYKITEGLELPPHVKLKGEDRSFVRILWPELQSPPFALIEGKSDFVIEDLTIFSANHNHIISGGFAPHSNIANPEAQNIAVRRVTIRASMYRGHLTPEESVKRLSGALQFSTGGPDTIRLSGRNVTIEDSDLYGSGRSFYLKQARGAYIARNKFYNGRLGWYSISGADGVIFEENQVLGADLQSTGGGINTLSTPEAFGQNVIFLHNRFEMMNGWDREALTSDGPGGCYYGPIDVGNSIGRDLSLLGMVDDLKRCVGSGVFIMGGRGMGQVRRIAAIDGKTIQLDLPFEIEPDSSSIVTVTSYQRNYLVINNEFVDAGVAVQFFGSSVGHVVAGNRSLRTGGFLNRGIMYRAYQPTWYTQFLDNRIVEGDLGRDAFIATWGAQKPPNKTPLSFATIIRGNILEGNAHIEARGYLRAAPGVQDVIIERNSIKDAEAGIVIDQGVKGAWLRDNSFRDVRAPIADQSSNPERLN